MPVEKLFGVGKVTAEKLNRLDVRTCADLRQWDLLALQQQFGKFGEKLFNLCRGIDTREVCSSREAKSISVEETYALDLPDLNACRQQLPALLEKLSQRIERAQRPRAKKLFLKIRFADFQQTTVECLGEQLSPAVFDKILETGFRRRDLPVRLLGIGIRLSSEHIERQLELFH